MPLVSSDVNGNLLVLWHDLQFIDDLSLNFPFCVFARMSNSVKDHMVGKFPEVFWEELSSEPMRCPEMIIEFCENAEPYCIFFFRERAALQRNAHECYTTCNEEPPIHNAASRHASQAGFSDSSLRNIYKIFSQPHRAGRFKLSVYRLDNSVA